MKILILVLALVAMNASAKELLYIGDSHSHIREEKPVPAKLRFGNVFYDVMKSRGYDVAYYAACGSAPSHWIKGSITECGYTAIADGSFLSVVKSPFPSVSSLYSSQNKVVINLGDNMFTWKIFSGKKVAGFNHENFTTSVNGFLALLHGINSDNCWWIGPTYHIEGMNYLKADDVVDEFYKNLESILADRCSVIDSRPIVVPTVPNDGLHHVNSDSQAWATGVLKQI
jgi:hypothetical protein